MEGALMKKTIHILALLAVGLASGLCDQSLSLQNPQRDPVGQILAIRGRVYLKANAKAKAIKLDPKRDQDRPLYAGESVRCNKGGFLRVLLNRKEEEIAPSKEWREFGAKTGDALPSLTRRAQAPARTEPQPSLDDSRALAVDLEKVSKMAHPSPAPTEHSRSKASAGAAASAGGKSSTERILEEYADALGPNASLVRSTEARGVFEIPFLGSSGSLEVYTKGRDKALAVVEVPGSAPIREGLNGESAWRQTPNSGVTDISPSQLWLAKFSPGSYSAIRLMTDYRDWRVVAETSMGNRDVYVLRGTPPNGNPEKFYFDMRSLLLVRVDSPVATAQGEFIFERYFEDYRDVDGARIPFRIRGMAPTGSFTVKLSEFKLNVAIDDSKFQKPKT
jgi:hypothetical protein